MKNKFKVYFFYLTLIISLYKIFSLTETEQIKIEIPKDNTEE